MAQLRMSTTSTKCLYLATSERYCNLLSTDTNHASRDDGRILRSDAWSIYRTLLARFGEM